MRPKELLIDLAVGPVLGAFSALYNRTISGFAELMNRVPRKLFVVMPIVSMVLVGVAAVRYPQVLGNGYDTVDQALAGAIPLKLLVLLPLLKMLLTAFTSASGVPGGLFTPSLVFGALLGEALGHLAAHFSPDAATPGAYALIGMAAILAATTHASVSAVLIIFELTGSYEVILPLMLTSVLAAVVSRALEPESLYTAPLRRRNVELPLMREPSPWREPRSIETILNANVDSISASTSFQEVVVRLIELPPGRDLYVTTPEGILTGVIVLEELKGHLPNHALLDMTVAADVMNTQIRPLGVRSSLAEVAARFSKTHLEHLPVVDERGRLKGTVSKNAVLRYGKF
jgi:CIC family chloride channel protein